MHSNSWNTAKFNHDHHLPRRSRKPSANPYTIDSRLAGSLGYNRADVAQLYIPKVLLPPLVPHNTDLDSFWTELENQFRDDLLGSTKKICAIKQSYSPQQLDYLNYFVIDYFEMVHTKLQQEDIQHSQVARNEVNYALYGERFWDWCVESQLYNDHILRNYSILLFKLLSLYPEGMLPLHYSLCTENLSVNILSSRPKSEFDFKIATYEPENDPLKIHNFIKRQGKCTFEDGSLYYENTFPSFRLFKEFFVAELNRCFDIDGIEFYVEFEISNFRFQAKTDECFNWIFSFKAIRNYYNELTLLILAISPVRKHFADNYGILLDIGVNSVTLRFDSTFYEGCEHFEFAIFEICVHDSSEEYRLFEFLSQLGCFGEFMGHLFYWARQNSLLDGSLFANDLEFAFMILFYLEQQRPFSKVPFPTIRKLTEDYPLLKRFSDLSQMWNDQHFLAKVNLDYFPEDVRIENWMVFDFFEFYHNFDFSTHVICPYDGLGRDKKTYEQRNKCKLSKWICIEDSFHLMHPISNESCTKERMQQFNLLIERMYLALKDRNQPEMFYIETLTNPKYFLTSENLSNESQVGDLETEIPDITSKGKSESSDHELVQENLIETISDLVADLNVNEKIVELNQNEAETGTENDLDESSAVENGTVESGTEEDQPNPEPLIGNQTGSNQEDDSGDDEDKCRVM